MKKTKAVPTTLIKSDRVEHGGFVYEYLLTARESKRVASYRIPLYSITVTLTNAEGVSTSATVTDGFSDIGKALVFYERALEHLATPIDLPYIFEDEYCT